MCWCLSCLPATALLQQNSLPCTPLQFSGTTHATGNTWSQCCPIILFPALLQFDCDGDRRDFAHKQVGPCYCRQKSKWCCAPCAAMSEQDRGGCLQSAMQHNSSSCSQLCSCATTESVCKLHVQHCSGAVPCSPFVMLCCAVLCCAVQGVAGCWWCAQENQGWKA